jgi:DNA-binding MarR family transcriptional regulator
MKNVSIENRLGSITRYEQNTSLILNLIHTVENIRYAEEFFFKKYNISNHQYNIMRILQGTDENVLSVMQIHERLVRKLSNTTRVIDKLVQQGYVIREINPYNKRQVLIHLTNKGETLLNEIKDEFDNLLSFLLKNLNESEKEELITLLEKIRS